MQQHISQLSFDIFSYQKHFYQLRIFSITMVIVIPFMSKKKQKISDRIWKRYKIFTLKNGIDIDNIYMYKNKNKKKKK